MSARRARKRLIENMQRRADHAADVKFIQGTIDSVTAGAATTGMGGTGTTTALATVNINGSVIAASYDSSYTPTVGDVVWVLLNEKSPYILGKPTGFPLI